MVAKARSNIINFVIMQQVKIYLLIVKLAVISLRLENAEDLRKGSRDGATVVRPAEQQNDHYPDDFATW